MSSGALSSQSPTKRLRRAVVSDSSMDLDAIISEASSIAAATVVKFEACAALGECPTADEPDVVCAAVESTSGDVHQDEKEEGAYDGDVDTATGAVLPPELLAARGRRRLVTRCRRACGIDSGP